MLMRSQPSSLNGWQSHIQTSRAASSSTTTAEGRPSRHRATTKLAWVVRTSANSGAVGEHGCVLASDPLDVAPQPRHMVEVAERTGQSVQSDRVDGIEPLPLTQRADERG